MKYFLALLRPDSPVKRWNIISNQYFHMVCVSSEFTVFHSDEQILALLTINLVYEKRYSLF